ncbi:MAG: hypothetical protein ACXABY_33280, partial [Candidatus Thorarchaeota archaeon]
MGRRKSFKYAGVSFASHAEREFAVVLDADEVQWMYEPEWFQWVPSKRKYTPDFKILRKDGSYFYLEFKGQLRLTDRTKMRAVK